MVFRLVLRRNYGYTVAKLNCLKKVTKHTVTTKTKDKTLKLDKIVYTSFLNKSRLFEFLVDIGRPFYSCIA